MARLQTGPFGSGKSCCLLAELDWTGSATLLATAVVVHRYSMGLALKPYEAFFEARIGTAARWRQGAAQQLRLPESKDVWFAAPRSVPEVHTWPQANPILAANYQPGLRQKQTAGTKELRRFRVLFHMTRWARPRENAAANFERASQVLENRSPHPRKPQ